MTAATTTRAPGPVLPAGQPPRRRAPAVVRSLQARTIPGRIRALAAAAIGVGLALGAITAVIFGSVASGVQLIEHRAAPEVTATTSLYFHINDMDAQVANMLLVGGQPGLGIDRQQALGIYQQDRTQADQALQQAAAVAGTTPSADRALATVLAGLGSYEALAAQVMYIDGQGASRPGRPPAAALALYRQATDLMRGIILPAAQRLTDAYASALNDAYQAKRSTARQGVLWVVLLGVALAAVLVTLQFYLALRHRRLLNPALALATLVTIGLTAAGAGALSAEAQHLQVAKKDAFDSILALSQARAVSYDTNADESRYLVDPVRAGQYQQAFLAKSQRLADLGPVLSQQNPAPGQVVDIFHYDAALAEAIDAYRANHADVRFGGYLGAEFRNITFTGERAAAEQALSAYQVYERDDRHIRALNARGELSAAIAFDTSYASGNSNWAFTQYDNAVVAVIAINQHAFDAAIQAGQQGTQGWTGLIPAGAVAFIIVATLVGVRPRLAEYR
jgi:hypothetical protein